MTQDWDHLKPRHSPAASNSKNDIFQGSFSLSTTLLFLSDPHRRALSEPSQHIGVLWILPGSALRLKAELTTCLCPLLDQPISGISLKQHPCLFPAWTHTSSNPKHCLYLCFRLRAWRPVWFPCISQTKEKELNRDTSRWISPKHALTPQLPGLPG